jgi:hypothetical protein
MVAIHPRKPAAPLRSRHGLPRLLRVVPVAPAPNAAAKDAWVSSVLADLRAPDIELRSDAPRERARDEA